MTILVLITCHMTSRQKVQLQRALHVSHVFDIKDDSEVLVCGCCNRWK